MLDRRAFLGTLAVLISPVAAATAADGDEAAIREIQARWDDAWNRHDIPALSALVAEDVRFINVAGMVLMGREAFAQLQTRTHATQFKDSVRTVTGTDIAFLTPDIAVAHVKWGMRGDRNADGTPRPPLITKADLENAELYNVGAGLLKPDEKLKSYDGLYTDEYVK